MLTAWALSAGADAVIFIACDAPYIPPSFLDRCRAAAQIFLIQLAGAGAYLPTEKAVAGKSYGGGVYDNAVGPDGGQTLVEETLSLLTQVWPELSGKPDKK